MLAHLAEAVTDIFVVFELLFRRVGWMLAGSNGDKANLISPELGKIEDLKPENVLKMSPNLRLHGAIKLFI